MTTQNLDIKVLVTMKRKFTRKKKGWGRKKERKKQTGCSCITFFTVCLLPLFDQSFNSTVLSVDIQKYDFWLVMHRKYSINVLSICFSFSVYINTIYYLAGQGALVAVFTLSNARQESC